MPPKTRSATQGIASRTRARTGASATPAKGLAASDQARGRVQKPCPAPRRRATATPGPAVRQHRVARARAAGQPRWGTQFRLPWHHLPNLPARALPIFRAVNLQPLPVVFTTQAEQPTRSFCGICYTQVPIDNSDTLGCCKARFCRTCLVRYLQGKVQDRSYPIKCPHFCPTRAVGLATLKRYLTAQELERHMETQVEKAVPAASRYYCPNPRCSKMLKRRGNSRKLTCPACKTVACCKCREAWHDTQRCSKAVHALPGRPELSQVAQELSLTRCDVCGAGVERTEGCTQMTCACGHMFDWGRNLGLI